MILLLAATAACSDPVASADSWLEVDAGHLDSTVSPDAFTAWSRCDTSSWPPATPPPGADLECAAIEVPRDYSRPEDGRFTLRVARQRSRSFPTGKAVFFLQGGPGGSAVEAAGSIPFVLPNLIATFDLVYVDRRGTGGSSYLACPGGSPTTKAEWVDCGAHHASTDLSPYLTVTSAHDIDAVTQVLGYKTINLYGVSYGSRLALEVMRQHEDIVAAAVLDGVATPDVDYFGDTLKALDRGVTMLVADCSKDPSCVGVVPNLLADLTQRRQTLRQQPRPIRVGGNSASETETIYLSALSRLLADARWRFKVPRAIHAAVTGDSGPWNDLLGAIWGLEVTPTRMVDRSATHLTLGPDVVAPALFIAVVCAEWLPNAGGVDALNALLAKQVWIDKDYFEFIGKAEACASWTLPPVTASMRSPVHSTVKTLLLNGELDLNTFPEQGARALEGLPAGTNIVVPHATHGVSSSVPCAAKIVNSFFLADGNMNQVDTTCLDSIFPPAW